MRAMRLFTPVLVLGFLASPVRGDQGAIFDDPMARASYSLGHRLGSDLKRQGATLDRPAVVKALDDGQSGTEPLMSPEEMEAQLTALTQRTLARLHEESKKSQGPFLKLHKKKPGVRTTDSGLQYRVIDQGTGRQPGPNDKVLLHYRGRTFPGREFVSTRQQGRGHPVQVAVNEGIPGWREGLQLMREGARYELFVPRQLGYTEGLRAHRNLIFEIELVVVIPQDTKQAESTGEEN